MCKEESGPERGVLVDFDSACVFGQSGGRVWVGRCFECGYAGVGGRGWVGFVGLDWTMDVSRIVRGHQCGVVLSSSGIGRSGTNCFFDLRVWYG